MANLKRTDIKGDTMYITTVKTHDRLPINLNKFAKEILKKYEHCNFRGHDPQPDDSASLRGFLHHFVRFDADKYKMRQKNAIFAKK